MSKITPRHDTDISRPVAAELSRPSIPTDGSSNTWACAGGRRHGLPDFFNGKYHNVSFTCVDGRITSACIDSRIVTDAAEFAELEKMLEKL